jgi:hypothetical protein
MNHFPQTAPAGFSPGTLTLDADLESRFLGNNLSEICAAAADSRDATFQSTAGFPIARRKEVMQQWRKAKVLELLEWASLQAFLETLEPVKQAAVFAGEVRLSEIAEGCEALQKKAAEEKLARLAAAKDALRGTLLRIVKDANPEDSETQIPFFLVITETGETVFFRRRGNAQKFARESGQRCLYSEIDHAFNRIFGQE